jgi:hypothetical protein
MRTHSRLARAACLGLLAAALALPAGCISIQPGGEKLFNSLNGIQTVVVAPMMNLCTSSDVDMLEVTNAFASELQQVEGLNVVPLGRVYQYLSANRMATVGSPEEARALAQVFKAQATIVGAVTEYDPYNPPRMGLAVQVYTVGQVPPAVGSSGFDPVEASRSAVPFPVTEEAANRPRDYINHIFSGRNKEVEDLARLYAARRKSDGTPYGWRRFLVDQREFQRLCSYGIIREMIGESGRMPQPASIKVAPQRHEWPK